MNKIYELKGASYFVFEKLKNARTIFQKITELLCMHLDRKTRACSIHIN